MYWVNVCYGPCDRRETFQVSNRANAFPVTSPSGDADPSCVWLSQFGVVRLNKPIQIGYDLWMLVTEGEGQASEREECILAALR
jgi:hypothetical protein